MDGEATLSGPDAMILLDELEALIPRLEAGELDDDLKEQTQRLIQALDRLPVPPDILEERVKEMGAWAELILEGRSEDERPGSAPVSTLLEDRIVRLRSMVDTGVEP